MKQNLFMYLHNLYFLSNSLINIGYNFTQAKQQIIVFTTKILGVNKKWTAFTSLSLLSFPSFLGQLVGLNICRSVCSRQLLPTTILVTSAVTKGASDGLGGAHRTPGASTAGLTYAPGSALETADVAISLRPVNDQFTFG